MRRRTALSLLAALPLFLLLVSIPLPPRNLWGQVASGYREALKLHAAGRYRDSIEKIRLIFDDNPASLQLRLLAAANYIELKEYNVARAHIHKALKEHADSLEPYIFKAALQRVQGYPKSAILTASRAMRLFGEKSYLHLEIASSRYTMGQFKRVRYHLQKVLELEPRNFYATYLEGLVFLKQGRYELAEFRFRNALELDIRAKEDLADLYNNLGVALEKRAEQYRRRKDFTAARRAYSEALHYYNSSLAASPDQVTPRKNQLRQQAGRAR